MNDDLLLARKKTQIGAVLCDDPNVVVAQMKMVCFPGHYMNHEPHNLTDAHSVEYWASPPGQVRDQAFVFELDQGHVVVRVEWKDRGDDMGVSKLSLEAHVGEGWQKLSTWDAAQTGEWQSHAIGMSLRSHQWRLSFASSHGDQNHLVVQAVRLIIRLPPALPAHNVCHSQQVTSKLWRDKLFTDVEVVCGTQRFQLHRAVLAAASPVFAAMLGSEMAESKSQQIVISDADEDAVSHALEYIYTGNVAEGTGCQVVVLGHKYDIPGLIEFAAPVALSNLTAENVCNEVRILRSYACDPMLGPVFEALQSKVHESLDLFHAVLLGI